MAKRCPRLDAAAAPIAAPPTAHIDRSTSIYLDPDLISSAATLHVNATCANSDFESTPHGRWSELRGVHLQRMRANFHVQAIPGLRCLLPN